jgi:hypothetical protein
MAQRYFHQDHKELLKDATRLAEELTSDFFKLGASHWRRARYDILTLENLSREEISPHAHALVAKYQGQPRDRALLSASFDFYRVCLQDHNILKAHASRLDLALFPLLLYIVTHELVHIVRFSQFLALFEASETQKLEEEERVHRLTRKILEPFKHSDMPMVVRYYADHGKEVGSNAHL